MGKKISKFKVLTVMACIIMLFAIFMFLNMGMGTGVYADPSDTPAPTDTPAADTSTPTPTPTPTAGGPTATPAPTATPIPPVLTSATYDVGAGTLVLTGTNFAGVKGTANDIDPTKIKFSNGVNHQFILTSSTKKVEIDSDKQATVKVCDKDKAVLAAWLDTKGKKDAANHTYGVCVLAGWNGPNSKTDVSFHELDVSGIASITSATYDVSTKKLVITGDSLVSVSTAKADIYPAYLTICDGAGNSYTLTSDSKGVKTDTGKETTQATVTLGDKDAAAIATWMNANGPNTVASNPYILMADAGWNGGASIGDLANSITVSNYAAPTATVADSASVTLGAATTAVTTDKIGTVYLLPASTDVSKFKVADLDALVAAKTAIKVSVTSLKSAPSISTKGLVTGLDTVAYGAVAVDTAGTLSTMSAKSITINNVAAATLTVSAKAGSKAGTTTLTVGTLASGDTISYKVSGTALGTSIPKVGLTPSSVTAFTNGDDITGADLTNKYLDVYELDSKGKVVKFKELTLTATSFKGPTYSKADLSVDKTAVTLTFDENIAAASTDSALKTAVKIATDGSKFAALTADDKVEIKSGTLVVTFKNALTTATNKISVAASALKDANGNKTAAVTTGAINASGPADTTAPTVQSAAFTNATTLVITFSEPVTAVLTDFSDGKISTNGTGGTATTFTPSAIAGSGTDTITLTVAGDATLVTGDAGTIDIAATVKDLANNALVALNDKAVTGF